MLACENIKLILIILINILVFCLNFGRCSNILALMPVASPSHHLWNSVITHALAERGHNITILSADIPKSPKDIPKKAYYIHLEEVYNTLFKSSKEEGKIDVNSFIGVAPHEEIPMFYDSAMQNYKGVINSKGFKTLLNYPDDFKFDLVLFDYTFGGPILGFLHKFKYPPLVGMSAFLMPAITSDFIGGHYYPSYIPFHSMSCDTNMSFWQRLYNTYIYVADTIYRRTKYTPSMDSWMRNYFPKDTPYLGDLQKRMIVALTNSHPVTNFPQPLPPNVIEIGGVQNKEPKPLDKELEDFMNASKKGGILFSLGTNMKPEDMGDKNINLIIQVMELFPHYHFFWKFDKNFIKRKLPSNILIRTLLPQKDLLAHPKLKIFVSHCGGLSTQEATWHGVPIVGIPLFVDQHQNLYKSILAGVAVKVDYLKWSVDILRNAIEEVLTNKTYVENMKIRSQRLRDRPMKPLDTAIWWIEYVLRHPDAPHLKSPVLELGDFSGNSFDILVFIIVLILIIILALISLFKYLLAVIHKKTKQTPNEKKIK